MTFLRTVYSFLFFLVNSMFIMTPLVHLYLLFGKVTEKKKYNLHRMLNFMSKFVLKIHGIPGIKYTESNIYGEDFSKPAVFICNHQSHLDLMPMLALTPKIIVLTADWVWKNPMYRFTIRNAEFLPATHGMDAIMPQLKSLVERGYSICVYPEGTRSEDLSIRRFHQGAFHISQTLGIDIVPMVIYGTGRALPKHGRLLRKWLVHLEINKRLSPSELAAMAGQTTMEQASWMRKWYKERYTELADRFEQNV